MTILATAPSRAEQRALCLLSDPQRPAPITDATTGVGISRLLALAQDHNVAPIVLRNLTLPDHMDETDRQTHAAAERDQAFIEMMTSVLDAQRVRLCDALVGAEIPFEIVKGSTFRNDLYPVPADRPFSDIDVMIGDADADRTAQIMLSIGFEQFKRPHLDRSRANREQKWGFQGDPLLLVEIHTDLVHVPRLRRRVGFSLEALEQAGDGGNRPMAGHFAVAVVHAAAGHKMHSLRLLTDVLQATRRLGAADIAHLAGVMDRLHLHPEVSACLSLVEQLFPDAGVGGTVKALRRELRLPANWTPVSASDVINAPYQLKGRSKVVRHAFRHYQMTIARRRSVGGSGEAETRTA